MATERKIRTDIEGLRGVAILLVVLFHAGVTTFSGGFVAVDVFFILSGFFITAMLVRELGGSGTIDLPKFYGQRLLRLIPLMLVVIAATILAAMVLYAPIDRAMIADRARGAALGIGNIEVALADVNYFGSGVNPLLHLWSLAVEVQFYLLWPLVLLAIVAVAKRRSADKSGAVTVGALLAGLLFTGVASLIASVWMTHASQPWAFFNLPARIWEFALGGVLALTLIDEKIIKAETGAVLQVVGLAALGFALVTYEGGMHYPGFAAVLPALGAAALIIGGAVAPESGVSKALSIGWLRSLGRLSYAWYLWHMPIVGIGEVINPTIGVPGKLAWSLAALGLAWLTNRWIEEPARTRLSGMSGRALTLGAAFACVGVACIALGAIHRAEREVSRPAQRTFAAAREDRMSHDCWATTIEERKGPCEFGDTTSDTTIVIFGDSHAEHWLGGLDRAGKERGWKIVAFVKGGCPVADIGEFTAGIRKEYYEQCTRYRAATLDRIIAMRPTAVILSNWDHYVFADDKPAHWKVTPHVWERGLRSTYARMAKSGIRTIAMRDVPHTPFDVPACLSRREARVPFARSCEYESAGAFQLSSVRAQTSALRGLPVRLVDMNDQICPTARCSSVLNGVVVFTDDNHLTASFSRSVAGVLGARISAALR